MATILLYYTFNERHDFNNNMLGFNGREARLAGRVREMEEQNQLLRRQLTLSQNHLVAAMKTNHSGKPQITQPPCQKLETADIPKCEVIHVAIVCAGYNASRSVVTLIKSILFYRKNPLHFHLLADSVAQVILQTLFSSWSVPQVNAYFISSENGVCTTKSVLCSTFFAVVTSAITLEYGAQKNHFKLCNMRETLQNLMCFVRFHGKRCTNYLFPQLETDSNNFIYQQDGAPPHWHLTVRQFLNQRICDRWIGRTGQNYASLHFWPSRSPDHTVYSVYVPALPTTMDELRNRITTAVESVTQDMLAAVWDEFEYRIDISRVSKVGHIEHL
ncbi:hypothetical protein J6590_011067 [Homalodisca vitripennis]|nr:hypothetical protein J6590_011067 [Homalodisca vitripennis]